MTRREQYAAVGAAAALLVGAALLWRRHAARTAAAAQAAADAARTAGQTGADTGTADIGKAYAPPGGIPSMPLAAGQTPAGSIAASQLAEFQTSVADQINQISNAINNPKSPGTPPATSTTSTPTTSTTSTTSTPVGVPGTTTITTNNGVVTTTYYPTADPHIYETPTTTVIDPKNGTGISAVAYTRN